MKDRNAAVVKCKSNCRLATNWTYATTRQLLLNGMKVKILLLTIALAGFHPVLAQTWTPTSAPTNFIWASLAASSDGKNLIADGILFLHGHVFYASTNYGLSWISNGSPDTHSPFFACSTTGNKMYAACPLGGIFISTNYGSSWQQTGAPTNIWGTIASSADGNKLVSAVGNNNGDGKGFIYISSDAGSSWTPINMASNCWIATASLADGSKLAVIPYFGSVFLSTNSGSSWTSNLSTSNFYWHGVACSADGQKLAALAGPTNFNFSIFTSADSGVTWASNKLSSLSFPSVACSADGNTIVVVSQGSSGIYVSTNQGVTWATNNVPNKVWYSVTSSADGQRFAATTADFENGRIFNSTLAPNPSLQITKSDGIQIFWLVPSTNFVLQQSSDLSNWSSVTNPPVLDFTNLQNQIALPLSASNLFFRLATP